MIIECINCNKKFNVNENLIPKKGRQIQCGSCSYIWHYQFEKLTSQPIFQDEKINENEINFEKNNLDNLKDNLNTILDKEPKIEDVAQKPLIKKIAESEKEIKTFYLSNFFSYLIVFIISVVAMIVLLDTLKSPLIDIYPGLEIILFNLFETLKDMKLFIIDLT